jgi:hypothetical protein
MQGVTRAACLSYLILMTALLLVSDPMRFIGAGGEGLGLLRRFMPVAHLLSFGLLAVLALAARWPLPRWAVVLVLVAYGAATEMAQRMLPPRTAEWNDWFQDAAGVAVGAVLCWITAVAIDRRTSVRSVAMQASEVSEMVPSVVPFRTAPRRSWWR